MGTSDNTHMNKYQKPEFKAEFLLPRYWGTLIIISVMYLLSLLPFKVQLALGRGIGRLAMRIMKKRQITIRRNLELCFPQMEECQREAILKDNIDNTGIALFETAMAWFWSDKRVNKHVTIKGMEHLEALEKSGKGALMLAVHSMNFQTTIPVLITFNTRVVLALIVRLLTARTLKPCLKRLERVSGSGMHRIMIMETDVQRLRHYLPLKMLARRQVQVCWLIRQIVPSCLLRW